MAFPKTRMRRLRASAGLRGLVRETQLQPRSADYAADAWQLSVRRVRSLLRAAIQFGAPKG